MENEAYLAMAQQEEKHWWYVGRRRILKSIIKSKILVPSNATLLEVGCGTGGNLDMLSTFGKVDAIELNEMARKIAQSRSNINVESGALPDNMPTVNKKYDLIAFFDVLEHIERDADSLKKLSELLSNDGRLIIAVPALPFLWSPHDEIHHHKRRYSKSGIIETVIKSGLRIEFISYYNFFLLPLAIIQRLFSRLKKSSDAASFSPILNSIFLSIFSVESHLIRLMPLPIGLSICIICKK